MQRERQGHQRRDELGKTLGHASAAAQQNSPVPYLGYAPLQGHRRMMTPAPRRAKTGQESHCFVNKWNFAGFYLDSPGRALTLRQ